MQGTTDGFTYGMVTPVVAFLMAGLGSSLGLRCTARSLRAGARAKAGWLALGAASIGSGIWTMHFIAMMGFSVREATITYDRPLTYASLALAVVMVGIGIFIVGYRGATRMALITGGTLTGLGIASMHYLGMAGMYFDGEFSYDTVTVILSVAIAVVAATAALWAAVSIRGFLPSLGASVIMAVAVSGMHYTGMASLGVHLHPVASAGRDAGDSATSILVPLLIGPAVFMFLAAAVVLFDPETLAGRDVLPGKGPAVPAAPSGPLRGRGSVRGIPPQRSRDHDGAPLPGQDRQRR
ncbi:MHYT domain-containing protein [uncultured Streptomyces sp.]|uniref:MHYT domain-containing protein n=1 Tax=uncultured Streptomyces sp. TaxID=174707 RepID=UPI00262A1BEF|nr:MHYT domain-containing protein [uncultured Streptomyces sp.]